MCDNMMYFDVLVKLISVTLYTLRYRYTWKKLQSILIDSRWQGCQICTL